MEDMKIFKGLVDDFYNAMPYEKKQEIFRDYEKRVKSRNDIRTTLSDRKKSGKDLVDKEMLSNSDLLKLRKPRTKGNSRNMPSEAILTLPEAVKCHIITLLMNSKYNFLVNGGIRLESVGYLFNLSRERIRQIEASAFRFTRHPELIRILNKNGEIQDIENYKEEAVLKKEPKENSENKELKQSENRYKKTLYLDKSSSTYMSAETKEFYDSNIKTI